MSRIYTREGDEGQTSIVGGTRVPKNGERVEAYGSVDEANCAVGLARASLQSGGDEGLRLDAMLDFVQHRLFDCSSLLATPSAVRAERATGPRITPADIERVESWIDELDAATGEIGGFVLPAGCEQACRLHFARTVVRRAERRVHEFLIVSPGETDRDVLAFTNRLSDLLFAMARYANHTWGPGDVSWDARTE